MSSILLVRPANNAVAIELSSWAAGLRNLAAASGHVSIGSDLASGSATRPAVDAALPGYEGLFFFGHGTPTKLLGAGVDLVDTSNVALAANHAIVAIACSSADTLGQTAVHQNGVGAYLGLTRKLTWVKDDPDGQFEPAICSGPRRLSQYGTMNDALADMQSELQNVVNHYHSGAGKATANAAIGFLSAFWDLNHLALIGNGSYTL